MEHSGRAPAGSEPLGGGVRSNPAPPDASSASSAEPRVGASTKLVVTVLEAFGRVSVPASVLLLSRGSTALAAAASAIALGATIARGFVVSFAVERAVRATFGDVVRAALRLAFVDLRAERKIGLLAEAAREAAVYEATVVPLIGAYAIAIVLTWSALVVVLGPLWAAALVLAVAPLVGGLAIGARRIRAEQEAAWAIFTDLSIDLRVLVEACLELRAHAREASFAEGITARARSFARAERRANVWSAASAALPSALVLLSAVTPVGGRIASLVGDATGARAAEIAIVAGAALYFALGLGKLLESRARYAPFREALRTFVAAGEAAGTRQSAPPGAPAGRAAPSRPERVATPAAPRAPASSSEPSAGLPSLVAATIRFRDVSCRHPNAPRATPQRVDFTWRPGRGLLLTGENGAGKTTLVLALLGLLPPSEGEITVEPASAPPAGAASPPPIEPTSAPPAGAASPRAHLAADHGRALRERCAYLAQTPFVEPGASVAWHLRLFARAPIDDARIDEALRRVGLWRVLEEHGSRGDRDAGALAPRDVPAGELSGGERQRMHIARVLVHDADLIVLDEPEAGLDREARTEMAALFESLTAERRVLVIAHDPAVVPPSFERLALRAEPRS